MYRAPSCQDYLLFMIVIIIMILCIIIESFFKTEAGHITAICLFVIWLIYAITISIVDRIKTRKANLNKVKENNTLNSGDTIITHNFNPVKKSESECTLIQQFLTDNKIEYFYYFTKEENIEIIKKYRGLLPRESISTDTKDNSVNTDDFIHLFTNDNCQMLQDNLLAGHKMVKLYIKSDVALWEKTLLISIQANNSRIIGGIPQTSNKDIKLTEILVNELIPIEYIQNLDHPKRVPPALYFDDYLIIDARNFSNEEQEQIIRAEVVSSIYGTAAYFFLKGGGKCAIPMSPYSKLYSGDAIDIQKARIVTLAKIDSFYDDNGVPKNINEIETITRIE